MNVITCKIIDSVPFDFTSVCDISFLVLPEAAAGASLPTPAEVFPVKQYNEVMHVMAQLRSLKSSKASPPQFRKMIDEYEELTQKDMRSEA